MNIATAVAPARMLRVALLAASIHLPIAAHAGTAGPVAPEVVYALGDIADCRSDAHREVAALIAADRARLPPGTASHLLFLGDQVYPDGSAAQFSECFDPVWGRFKGDALAVPGNHDYRTDAGAPFYAYFGAPAAPTGYFSRPLGDWRVLALNSNIDIAEGSVQLRWLKEQLAGNPHRCVLAIWHHPRFSSGAHGSNPSVEALWRTARQGGVSLVLAGHDHHYERFVPLDASGRPDDSGTRSFVVGTGGAGLYPVNPIRPTISAARIAQRHGVLRLELAADRYRWRFLALPDGAVLDAGDGVCISPPAR